MTNYNFNGMNAQTIAQKIVDREMSYFKVDFDSLSFEDKCHYLLDKYSLVHPRTATERIGWYDKLESLRPELVERAEAGDALALYLLGGNIIDKENPCDTSCLERAFGLGYMLAGVILCDAYCFQLRRLSKQADVACEQKEELTDKMNALLSKLKAHAEGEGKNDENFLYSYYSFAKELTDDVTLAAKYRNGKRKLAEARVQNGSYPALIYLCVNRRAEIEESAEDKTKALVRATAGEDEEYSFYKTVEYIVESELYEEGHSCPADHLCDMLIGGIGCEPDYARAKDILVEEFFNYGYSKELLLKYLGLESEDDIPEFMADTYANVLGGKISDAWKLVLATRLGDDKAALDTMCTEILSLEDSEIPARSIAKAYSQYRRYACKTDM